MSTSLSLEERMKENSTSIKKQILVWEGKEFKPIEFYQLPMNKNITIKIVEVED